MTSGSLEFSRDRESDEVELSMPWAFSQSTEAAQSQKPCFSPPPPFQLPPLDPSLQKTESFDASRPLLPNYYQNLQLAVAPPNECLLFLETLILRQESYRLQPNRSKCPIPKDILDFAFEKYSLSSARLPDEVLFQAFELFRCFDEVERLSSNLRGPRPKEVLAAAILLASKIDNVRHISVKTLMEFGGLSFGSYQWIIETEAKLFLSLNGLLQEPTALSFIRAYFPVDDNTENLLPQAYHLAVYILALNMKDADLSTLTAQDVGRISAWLVILILDLKRSPNTIALRTFMGEERYGSICRQFLRTALENSRDAKSPLNKHFASAKRSRVRQILLKTARR